MDEPFHVSRRRILAVGVGVAGASVAHADSAGRNQPAEGVELKADISMPGMAHHASFDDRGKGDYEAQVTLEMAGMWDVDLNASKDGRTKQQRLNIEVGN